MYPGIKNIDRANSTADVRRNSCDSALATRASRCTSSRHSSCHYSNPDSSSPAHSRSSQGSTARAAPRNCTPGHRNSPIRHSSDRAAGPFAAPRPKPSLRAEARQLSQLSSTYQTFFVSSVPWPHARCDRPRIIRRPAGPFPDEAHHTYESMVRCLGRRRKFNVIFCIARDGGDETERITVCSVQGVSNLTYVVWRLYVSHDQPPPHREQADTGAL